MTKARSRFWWVVGGLALLTLGGAWWANAHFQRASDIPLLDATPEAVAKRFAEFETNADANDAGLCPWRDPERDLKQFFPHATGYRDEMLILSRNRGELEKRLGRAPTGEETAFKLHRILEGERPVGTILTRRMRGESGVLELVLAVDNNRRVVGAKVQRLREPDDVASALRSPSWLRAWHGKTAQDTWQSGKDVPSVPAIAEPSARALLEGAHTALLLLDVGVNAAATPKSAHSAHTS